MICACLLLLCACGGGAGPASASTSGEGKDTLISHTGTWTFARLGLPEIVVVPGHSQFREVVIHNAFRLPKGARQGPKKWFVLHLHYEVDIAPDPGPGGVVLSVNTNGGYSAQIIFTVRRLPSGELNITSDSLGLVSGHVIRHGHERVWRAEFENYIPYAGIRGGANSLGVVVKLDPDSHAYASRAVVFPDSAIVYGRKSPPGY